MSDKAITKLEKIQLIEEKLKKLEKYKIQSEYKSNFNTGIIEKQDKKFNLTNETELLPQSRRPKRISLAHKHLKEAKGDDYDQQPYDNFLGSK